MNTSMNTSSTKKTVLLRGPMITMSGYGVHTRQIARWLFRVASEQHDLDITTEPLPWGDTHLLVDPEAEDGLIGQILQASGNKKSFYDVTIQVQLPNEWNPFLGNFNVGVTAGVETDKCNPAWIDCINRMDMIVVPSTFTKETFMATGEIKVPVAVIPEAFPDAMQDQNQLIPEDPDLDLGLTTKFNLLVVGQLTGTNPENDRKNLPYTLKWIAETFAGNKDIGVIVKTNAGAQTQLDKKNVEGIFKKLVTEIQPAGVPGPTFYLLHGHMTDEEMNRLYRHKEIAALISLTHGEGYGLPILEAAACGLPVIATNWSGHLEFLKHGKFIPVDRMLGEVPASRVDGQIFLAGMKWANPVEIDVKRRLRKFYESSSMPKQWARELARVIQKEYSFDAVSRIYSKALGGVLGSS